MKHSDTTKAILLSTINEIAADPRKYAVSPGRDFTRNRKMGFNDTIMILLTMEADCIKEELYRYFGRNTNAPSKTAFYKQRKKLNEGALSNLLFTGHFLRTKRQVHARLQPDPYQRILFHP